MPFFITWSHIKLSGCHHSAGFCRLPRAYIFQEQDSTHHDKGLLSDTDYILQNNTEPIRKPISLAATCLHIFVLQYLVGSMWLQISEQCDCPHSRYVLSVLQYGRQHKLSDQHVVTNFRTRWSPTLHIAHSQHHSCFITRWLPLQNRSQWLLRGLHISRYLAFILLIALASRWLHISEQDGH
jgi:hypothetical protein